MRPLQPLAPPPKWIAQPRWPLPWGMAGAAAGSSVRTVCWSVTQAGPELTSPTRNPQAHSHTLLSGFHISSPASAERVLREDANPGNRRALHSRARARLSPQGRSKLKSFRGWCFWCGGSKVDPRPLSQQTAVQAGPAGREAAINAAGCPRGRSFARGDSIRTA